MTLTVTRTAEILVLRTNVETMDQKQNLLNHFNGLATVTEVSIDMEDIDKVLRIVTVLSCTEIIQILNEQGFDCSELE